MNVKHALTKAQTLQTESPRVDVEVLLMHVLSIDRAYLFAYPETELTDQQVQTFLTFLQRRERGEPIAHLVGEKEFWSLTLNVDSSTLIPRPDTERLIEVALEQNLPRNAHILDLGTGTGAIALALAKELPEANVVAVDVSPQAVALAKTNAARHQLQRVRFLQSHWFDAVEGRFDLIVSNPPYIDASDPHLKEGDVRYEPTSALVAADQGLFDLRHIVEQGPQYLALEGVILLEHGWQQAQAVRHLLLAGPYHTIQTWNDYGGQERVTGAHLASP